MIFGRAENIRILGYLSGFGGAGIGGEFPLKRFDAPLGDFGKVGGAGIEKADDAVEVLDGAFLPSTVGMAVVDGDMKEGFKCVFMEKLRAIIGENRLKFGSRRLEKWLEGRTYRSGGALLDRHGGGRQG